MQKGDSGIDVNGRAFSPERLYRDGEPSRPGRLGARPAFAAPVCCVHIPRTARQSAIRSAS